MDDKQARLKAFWQGYLDSLPPASLPPQGMPQAWHFCDTEPCANELVALVLAGIKTATCGSLIGYEHDGDPVPQVGDLSIVTDWDGEPLCVIETTEITLRPYDQVDARFAYDEGEGDRSLAYWREAHRAYFNREGGAIGYEFDEAMTLVCERFRVVYAP